jgi:hypothetical protein
MRTEALVIGRGVRRSLIRAAIPFALTACVVAPGGPRSAPPPARPAPAPPPRREVRPAPVRAPGADLSGVWELALIGNQPPGQARGHEAGGPPGQARGHDEGGPPGQARGHDEGGPPGQARGHDEGGPPGQARGHDEGGPPGQARGHDEGGPPGQARGRERENEGPPGRAEGPRGPEAGAAWEPRRLDLRQTVTALTILEEGGIPYTIPFDGRPSVVGDPRAGVQARMTGVWHGRRFDARIELSNGTVLTQAYELSKDGASLTILVHQSGGRRPQARPSQERLVYRRAGRERR